MFGKRVGPPVASPPPCVTSESTVNPSVSNPRHRRVSQQDCVELSFESWMGSRERRSGPGPGECVEPRHDNTKRVILCKNVLFCRECADLEVPRWAGFYGDLRKAATRSGSFSGLISVLPQRRTCVCPPPPFPPSPVNPTSMAGHKQPIKPGLAG